ncbi:hypothetical protein E3A20_04260 [Planctomyces bekefii]|uniref:Uncharacterized protein n=1 Tax=Planctomyces bekefii TaxID=1653850 RepID=A0A5C6MAD0_9PLAN|nr:hypothetical protein E3A20_04260 [Planctomyces bekefii]
MSADLVALENTKAICGRILEGHEVICAKSEAAAAAFRDLHTLKGAASINNLGRLVNALHRSEGALDLICKQLLAGKVATQSHLEAFRLEITSVLAVADDVLKSKFSKAKTKTVGSREGGEDILKARFTKVG